MKVNVSDLTQYLGVEPRDVAECPDQYRYSLPRPSGSLAITICEQKAWVTIGIDDRDGNSLFGAMIDAKSVLVKSETPSKFHTRVEVLATSGSIFMIYGPPDYQCIAFA